MNKLDDKTKKMVGVCIQLVVATILVSLLFVTVWSKWLWVGLLVWAAWRFALRLIIFGFGLCSKCGRIKVREALSPNEFHGKTICLKCMERYGPVGQTLDKLNTAIDSLGEIQRYQQEESRMRARHEQTRLTQPPSKDEDLHENI